MSRNHQIIYFLQLHVRLDWPFDYFDLYFYFEIGQTRLYFETYFGTEWRCMYFVTEWKYTHLELK